jgi:hypothetical protein
MIPKRKASLSTRLSFALSSPFFLSLITLPSSLSANCAGDALTQEDPRDEQVAQASFPHRHLPVCPLSLLSAPLSLRAHLLSTPCVACCLQEVRAATPPAYALLELQPALAMTA